MNDPVAVRDVVENDIGYIIMNWSRQFWKQHPNNFVEPDIYVPRQTRIIKTLLNTCCTRVLCIDDEPDSIIGFVVYQDLDDKNVIIHYGQVKGVFRRFGYFKHLLESIGAANKTIIYTHDFKLLKKVKDRYPLVYKPELLKDIE